MDKPQAKETVFSVHLVRDQLQECIQVFHYINYRGESIKIRETYAMWINGSLFTMASNRVAREDALWRLRNKKRKAIGLPALKL